jgi:hypothetical protein
MRLKGAFSGCFFNLFNAGAKKSKEPANLEFHALPALCPAWLPQPLIAYVPNRARQPPYAVMTYFFAGIAMRKGACLRGFAGIQRKHALFRLTAKRAKTNIAARAQQRCDCGCRLFASKVKHQLDHAARQQLLVFAMPHIARGYAALRLQSLAKRADYVRRRRVPPFSGLGHSFPLSAQTKAQRAGGAVAFLQSRPLWRKRSPERPVNNC